MQKVKRDKHIFPKQEPDKISSYNGQLDEPEKIALCSDQLEAGLGNVKILCVQCNLSVTALSQNPPQGLNLENCY